MKEEEDSNRQLRRVRGHVPHAKTRVEASDSRGRGMKGRAACERVTHRFPAHLTPEENTKERMTRRDKQRLTLEGEAEEGIVGRVLEGLEPNSSLVLDVALLA